MRVMAGFLALNTAMALVMSPDVTAEPAGFAEQSSPRKSAGGGIQGIVVTTARTLRPLRVTFDQKVCGEEVPDQSIVVDGTGHVANAVVTLVGVKSAAPAREARVVNQRCAFTPRVQVVGARASLKTSSTDPVLHTTTVQLPGGRQLFNLALPVPNLELTKPLDGTGPLRVGCSTHQWMRGWIYVTDDVSAVTDSAGRFQLPEVQPGTYRLRVWHESLKAVDQTVTVTAGVPLSLTITLK